MHSSAIWWVVGIGAIGAAVFLAVEESQKPQQKPPPDPAQAVTRFSPPAPDDANAPAKKPTVEERRKKYPFESIAGRLDYEPAGVGAFAKTDPPPKVTADTLKRLAVTEQTMADLGKGGMRIQSLKLLHSDQAQKFIDRDGFGLSRMPAPSTMFLELPAAPTILFATARDVAADDKPAPASTGAPPKNDALAAFHQRGTFDFLNPSAFGFVKDRDHVAGFRPHEFRQLPALPAAEKAPAGKMEQWAVVRLELVSLLKHDRPVVYVTNALPRMTDTDNAPVRALIPFEDKALNALKGGDDIATESSADHIRMLGSLRAGKQCLECHEVKRGDLLGAFSWELERQTADDNRLP
jgi:hypothetical protein